MPFRFDVLSMAALCLYVVNKVQLAKSEKIWQRENLTCMILKRKHV
jgi:hypothetical protein